MLLASKYGVFKHRYELSEDDQPVTELANFRRESCEFTIDGEALRVSRERSKRFVFEGPRGRIASADRESSNRWAITTSTGKYELVRPSYWRSAWELRHGDRSVGRIEPGKGLFNRTSQADLSADLPIAVRVFAFYVVLIQWQRAAAAAASQSGS
ncbi:hypothetical protein [Actinophytocola sediminis]